MLLVSVKKQVLYNLDKFFSYTDLFSVPLWLIILYSQRTVFEDLANYLNHSSFVTYVKYICILLMLCREILAKLLLRY